MCPIVPSIPEVVILPSTVLSSPTLILPSPLASVVTAGTSWSPVRVTLTSLALATVKLAASSVAKAARWRIELILIAPLDCLDRPDRKVTRKNAPVAPMIPAALRSLFHCQHVVGPVPVRQDVVRIDGDRNDRLFAVDG